MVTSAWLPCAGSVEGVKGNCEKAGEDSRYGNACVRCGRYALLRASLRQSGMGLWAPHPALKALGFDMTALPGLKTRDSMLTGHLPQLWGKAIVGRPPKQNRLGRGSWARAKARPLLQTFIHHAKSVVLPPAGAKAPRLVGLPGTAEAVPCYKAQRSTRQKGVLRLRWREARHLRSG